MAIKIWEYISDIPKVIKSIANLTGEGFLYLTGGTVKLLAQHSWSDVKNIPSRIQNLISLSVADGAIFLDGDENYRVVPFGSASGQIAEGNHQHDTYQLVSEKNQQNGYVGLNSNGMVEEIQITNRITFSDSSLSNSLLENNSGNCFIRNNGDNIYLQVFSGNRSILFQGRTATGVILQIAQFNRDFVSFNVPVNFPPTSGVTNGVSGSFISSDGKNVTVSRGIITAIEG